MSDRKHVVITGASSGIGAALAVQLGAAGHRVALAARREPELQEVAGRAGTGAIVVPTDVTKRGDVERLRDRAIEAFGHVDVWVNNAGRGITKPVLELTDEELDLMMTVNVKSALYGMQAIAPHFIARRCGQIVNVSSFLSRVPFATFRSGYNAAKAALNALTANARVDLAREHPGIQVTLVMPGLVHTEFQRNALGGSPPIPPVTDAQSVEDAVAAIVSVIDHPVAEIYTNPRQAAIVRDYFQDVGAFEQRGARGSDKPRKPRWWGGVTLVAAAAYACGGTAAGPSRLPSGVWGGDHIAMSVSDPGTHLELDCAHGDIPVVPTVGRQGQFEVAGTYVREHGGPVRQGETVDSHPAVYSGAIASTTMTLTIRLSDTNETAGTFTLVSGSSGRVFKCL